MYINIVGCAKLVLHTLIDFVTRRYSLRIPRVQNKFCTPYGYGYKQQYFTGGIRKFAA